VRYIVKVMPNALRQLETIARWWRANRREAPDLAESELLGLIDSLAEHPERGMRGDLHTRARRRMLAAPRSRLLVIYRVRSRARRLEVVEIRRP
jgi:hypothetical protein